MEKVPKTKMASQHRPMHQFNQLFKEHLLRNSTLSMASIELNARLITNVIKYAFGSKGEESFHGMGLIKTFLSLGDEGSYLRRKTDTLSGSYCAKSVLAAMRVVDFLKDQKTQQRWYVEDGVAEQAKNSLTTLLKRYQKVEKRERIHSREAKERNTLTPEEVRQILDCQAVSSVLTQASESLENKNKRPITIKDVTALRDALITSLAIRSLRRSLEFTEFTLEEWKNRTFEKDETSVVKVKTHKTMAYGSANIVLSKTEDRALKAYVSYGRPLIASCETQGCPVFTSRHSPGQCCSKLHISTVSTILRKVALKAGVTSRTVNTRMLRRSTISGAWKTRTDPSFRQELSQLAGHSYETARRYYAVYDTAKQSRQVVEELEKIRR